jgi:V8-like Glu-specific endopeptidase
MGAIAAVGYQLPFGEIVGCSAVVLTPRIVVTAAHCTVFSQSNFHLPFPIPPPLSIFVHPCVVFRR